MPKIIVLVVAVMMMTTTMISVLTMTTTDACRFMFPILTAITRMRIREA